MADDDSSDDDLDQQQQPPSRYLATVRMPSGTASRSSRASVSSSGSDSDSDDAGSAAVLHSVTALNSSLSAFEQTHIRPLVGPDGRSLRDTLAGISDEVERAKLLVTLGYVIEDLVWIYLKTKGINPESHPVVPELQRIRTYFTKIQDAVNPPKRTMAVDRPAAARFIRSALASNGQRVEDRSGADDIGMQTRFNVLKHQEAILRQPDSDDESSGEEVDQGLELIQPPSASGSGSGAGGRARPSAAKGKGKAKASGDAASDAGASVASSSSSDVVVIDAGALEQAATATTGPGAGAKRPSPQAAGAASGKSKRAKIDPFAGYDSAGGAGSPSSAGKAGKSPAGRKRSTKSRA